MIRILIQRGARERGERGSFVVKEGQKRYLFLSNPPDGAHHQQVFLRMILRDSGIDVTSKSGGSRQSVAAVDSVIAMVFVPFVVSVAVVTCY